MLRTFSQDGKSNSTTKKTDCVECSSSTKYICVQCNSNPYCKLCFDKVHAAGVVFRTHDLIHSDCGPTTIGHVLGLCKDHGKKKLDYYCQSCSMPICYTCVNTTHGKHDTTNLVKNVCD